MCQQGSTEIHLERRAEINQIYAEYNRYKAGLIELSDEQLRDMAVRLMVLKY